MKTKRLCLIILLCGWISYPTIAATVDLSGDWRFAWDGGDVGVGRQWFLQTLADGIQLPGVLTAQGYGEPTGMATQWFGDINGAWTSDPYYKQYQTADNFKMPFWLQPDRHYVGQAWYQRDLVIPAGWAGKRVVLFLERPHWQTTVWLDGRRMGSCDRLGTPHEYDLGMSLKPGRYRLTIAVDNRMIVNVGPNSHSVSDHTQGNWNGIAGRIELRATDPVWIDEVRVYPRFEPRQMRVETTVGNLTGQAVKVRLGISVDGRFDRQLELTCPAGREVQNTTVELDDSLAGWDEFTPQLYPVKVTVQSDRGGDEKMVRFGLRDLKTEGTRFILNGVPIFLRGTLECCIFPLTGHPPTDVESWKRIIRICKAHGLNHIRFHSWCPPEAAFVAADELGFYYQVECSSWANQGASIGDGKPLDDWLTRESEAMIRAYGNHPSFMLMAYGNEPAGKNQKEWLAGFVQHWQKTDPRRLYTTGAGWPILPVSDYHSSPDPRIQRWGEGLKSIINRQPPSSDYDWRDFVMANPDAPVVSHEIGQWCVYPNLEERAKYTGLLKAKNFDIFADQLKRNGMLDQARDFLMASGKLQALCYKADIEAALRTPGFGGFQLLDLHDFPGQGTALVGVLDPFWDSKGYITPEEYHRFCGPIVPLVCLPKHIYLNSETVTALVELAQFGPADLKDITPVWSLTDTNGAAIAQGKLEKQFLPRGELIKLGKIAIPLNGIKTAQQVRLTVTADGQSWGNDWDLWVYPEPMAQPAAPGIMISRELDEVALAQLEQGGKLLWLPDQARIKGDPQRGRVALGFSSIFWNTIWTNFQPPHTLGILCDPAHPALAQFPTETYSNWQWWELVHNTTPFILTGQPVKPVVQVIDDWVTARKLGLVFEAKVDQGKLVACSIDLAGDLADRPVARQLRASLLAYMASDRFNPVNPMTLEALQALCQEPTRLQSLGAKASTDSFQTGYQADLAIDGNATTFWHTGWEPAPDAMPHELIVTLKNPVELAGITYLPRQDMANGRIGKYDIYLSDDGKSWTGPVASGQWPNNGSLQTIRFDRKHPARAFKLRALSSVNNQPFAGAAEIDILTD